MGFALTTTAGDKFYFQTCANCGMSFGIPHHYENERRDDHKTFYCPNGHPNYYPGKSQAEKLAEQLQVERNRREWAERDRDHNERRRRAAQGKVTLLKRRMSRGQCPCCKQKFSDLQQHMEKQHPEYAE